MPKFKKDSLTVSADKQNSQNQVPSLHSLSDTQLMSLLKKAHEELGDIYFEMFKRQEVENATDLIHHGIENLINSFIMTEFNNFLGYAKNSHTTEKTQNRRNGYYRRELNFIGLQDSFTVKLPRDREGLFKSSLFDVHARYLPEHEDLLDNLTLSLRKRGISQQTISDALSESLDGVSCSQATISRNLNHEDQVTETKIYSQLITEHA